MRRLASDPTANSPDVTGSVRSAAGYPRSDRTDMRQLIDATRR